MNRIIIDENERFQTIMFAANKYHVSRRVIMNAAEESGALIKITDRTIRIDMQMLDKHIRKNRNSN